jgi:hypothetical protein
VPHPLVLALVLTVAPVAAPHLAVPIPTSATEALIVNSGSTNTAGYALRVRADGTGTLLQGETSRPVQLSRTLVDRLFADLRAAGPLDVLPHRFCMKSASFGTTTTVAYRGKRSPDLSCPGGSAAGYALAQDARALAGAAAVDESALRAW